MLKRKYSVTILSVLVISLLGFMTDELYALSPTECAKIAIPNTLSSASSNAEKYAAFSLIDQSTFNQNKSVHDGAASYFGYGYGSANFTWDDFTSALAKYKTEQASDLDASSALSIYQSIIPTDAYKAYETCITQNEQGPVLTAILERQGAQNDSGSYTAFAVHLAFVAGGGSSANATVTVASSDPNVTVTSGNTIKFTGSGSQTLLVTSASSATSTILSFNSETTTADPITIIWKQPSLAAPKPAPVVVGLCRMVYPGAPPYQRGTTQTTLSPHQCRVMADDYSKAHNTNASYELGCRVDGVDTWDTAQPGGDSDPAFTMWINHDYFPSPCK